MRAFLKNENGATAIEYCLIGTAMAVALIVAMPFLANGISNRFNTLANALTQNFN